MLRTVIIAAVTVLLTQTAAHAQSSVFSAAYVTMSEAEKLADSGFDVRTAGFGASPGVPRGTLTASIGADVRMLDAKQAAKSEPEQNAANRFHTVTAGPAGWSR